MLKAKYYINILLACFQAWGKQFCSFDLAVKANIALDQYRLESKVTLTSFLVILFASQGHGADVYWDMMDYLLLHCTLIFVPPTPAPHTFTHPQS